jgi:hypothetical protein
MFKECFQGSFRQRILSNKTVSIKINIKKRCRLRMFSFNSKKHSRDLHLSIARIVSDVGARETQDKDRARKNRTFSR